MRGSVDSLIERVLETITRYNMLRPADRVGVAVSGGADSVCLLYALRDLAPRLGLHVRVAHLNHKLRGAESDGDAWFVEELAGHLGLPFLGETADVSDSLGNLEQAGRTARRQFFSRLIASGWADRVATGHTRSDQAETVLYRLLRGSGTAGLAGILPVTSEGTVRPLIQCDRVAVEAFLRTRAVEWREDRTNADERFARNRIRHCLVPMLVQQYNPAVQAVLATTAETARLEEDFWAGEVETVLPKIGLSGDSGSFLLRTAELCAQHAALQRRIVRRVIAQVKGDLRSIGVLHVEQVLKLAVSPEGRGRLDLPGIFVQRSFGWVRFALQYGREEIPFDVPVTPPARVVVPGGAGICLDVIDISALTADNSYNEFSFIDFDRLSGPLAVRNWRPGDRYSSKSGGQKIKHLFQQARIPIWERPNWPVMTSGGKIVWARQFGVAAEVAPDVNTRTLLCIRQEDRAFGTRHADIRLNRTFAGKRLKEEKPLRNIAGLK
jgi:tRNA(Ile)-lysidine synthase